MTTRVKIKENLFKIAAILIGLIIGVIILLTTLYIKNSILYKRSEVSQSIYNSLKAKLDYNPKSLYKFDPDVSYLFKPQYEGHRHLSRDFVHQTNSLSLLGKEEINSDSITKKILFLGDSVTYGDSIPFNKIFTSIIQNLAGRKFQIANGSCPGWSTHQEIIFFKKYLTNIKWEAVVIVFVANDLVKFEWVFHNDKAAKMSPEILQIGGFRDLTKSILSYRLHLIRYSFRQNEKTKPLARHNHTSLLAWYEPKWTDYEKNISNLLSTMKVHSNLILVAIPTLPQVEALTLGAHPDIVFYPQKKLKDFANQQDIYYINAIEAFKGIKVDKSYYKDDLHLSAKGHTVIGQYLWDVIKNRI